MHTIELGESFNSTYVKRFYFVLPSPKYSIYNGLTTVMSSQAWPVIVYSFQEIITFYYECLLSYTECNAVKAVMNKALNS
jgi:hypothetical protein